VAGRADTNPPTREYGIREKNRKSEKVEAFADDNNLMAKLDENSLRAIKNILLEFGILSGLKCNVDKSQIMLINNDNPPQWVRESGFAITNTLKILGFNVTTNFDDLASNFPPILQKIRGIATFWHRFN
jgi:hypothetical protein